MAPRRCRSIVLIGPRRQSVVDAVFAFRRETNPDAQRDLTRSTPTTSSQPRVRRYRSSLFLLTDASVLEHDPVPPRGSSLPSPPAIQPRARVIARACPHAFRYLENQVTKENTPASGNVTVCTRTASPRSPSARVEQCAGLGCGRARPSASLNPRLPRRVQLPGPSSEHRGER
jgi:hypothetical protein